MLLEEGVNCLLFEELADLGRQDSRLLFQRCILREVDGLLLGHVVANVFDAEDSIPMIVLRRAMDLSPHTGVSCCVIVLAAPELA